MPLNSGLKLCDEAVKLFGDMKIGSKSTRYFTLKLNDDNTCIDIEHKVPKTEIEQEKDFEELMNGLTETCGRFVLVDLKVSKANGSTSDQLYCIMW